MKKVVHYVGARLLGSAVAIALIASCSYGIVEDPSGNLIPGAFVSFRGADLSGTSTGPVTLGSSTWVYAWSPGDPGSNGTSGIFYLNPWGTLNSGDTRSLFTSFGW